MMKSAIIVCIFAVLSPCRTTAKYIFQDNLASYHIAQSQCSKLGGTIAFFGDELNSATLDAIAHDHNASEIWSLSLIRHSSGTLMLENGESLAYNNWLSVEQESAALSAVGQVCVAVKETLWTVRDCDAKLPSICVITSPRTATKKRVRNDIPLERERRHPHTTGSPTELPSQAPTRVPPCTVNPCQNGGTCIPIEARERRHPHHRIIANDDNSGSGEDILPTDPDGDDAGDSSGSASGDDDSGSGSGSGSSEDDDVFSSTTVSGSVEESGDDMTQDPPMQFSTLIPTTTTPPTVAARRYVCECMPGFNGDVCEILPSLSPSTSSPSLVPSEAPTTLPSDAPTRSPSYVPSISPSLFPTSFPTSAPTVVPSSLPTSAPTVVPSSLPTLFPSHSPTPLPTVLPTHVPSSYPSLFPTLTPSSSDPTSAPTLSCEAMFEQSVRYFPDPYITFEPGTAAGTLLSGTVLDESDDNITASSIGATRINMKVAFLSKVWNADEPKIGVRLVNDAAGPGRSFILSGSVNITRDNSCVNGQFQDISEHPGTSNPEMRTLRFGVGVAEVSAVVGSWSPKIPDYTLEVYLLRREWSQRMPPQAMASITGIDLSFNTTFINFLPYLLGSHPNSQRMIPYSSQGMGLDLNVTWSWRSCTGTCPKTINIIAVVHDQRCPANNCVLGSVIVGSTGLPAHELPMEGNAVLRVNLKPETPFVVADAHELRLYMLDSSPQCETTGTCTGNMRDALIAESNAFSFRVYASGARSGESLVDGTSSNSTRHYFESDQNNTVFVVALFAVLSVFATFCAVAIRRYRRLSVTVSAVSPVSQDPGTAASGTTIAFE